MKGFSNEKKQKGQYFTPQSVVDAIIDRLSNLWQINLSTGSINILEPSIGEGVFLISILKIINRLNTELEIDSCDKSNLNLYGFDIDEKMVDLTTKRLNSIELPFSFNSEIYRLDFLQSVNKTLNNTKFDLIIGNPPHSASYSTQDWENVEEEHKEVVKGIFKETSVYFTLIASKLLRENGILVFILPKPIVDSNRWKTFRLFLLQKLQILEIWDIGCAFSESLQEQVVLFLKNNQLKEEFYEFNTAIVNTVESLEKFNHYSPVSSLLCLKVDNLLVGVTSEEMTLTEKLNSPNYEKLNITAFRGVSSKFRLKEGSPLIEKRIIGSGFLFSPRFFVDPEQIGNQLYRQSNPKIIANRIMSYSTNPIYQLITSHLFVDNDGSKLTHETVINIFSKDSKVKLNSLAGILMSNFCRWYIQNVIFSKTFVTSKDLDLPYLKKIPFPSYPNMELLTEIGLFYENYQNFGQTYYQMLEEIILSDLEKINDLEILLKRQKWLSKLVLKSTTLNLLIQTIKDRKELKYLISEQNILKLKSLIRIHKERLSLYNIINLKVNEFYSLTKEEIDIINIQKGM